LTIFDQFEARSSIPKHEYGECVQNLRQQLLAAQFALENTPHPLILVIAGVDGAGKGVLVHRLNEWMDPRGIDTNTFWEHSDEQESRPYFWRFWQALPARGRTGIFLGSWYTKPTQQYVDREIRRAEFDRYCRSIEIFERQLSDDGAIIVKLWLHVSEATQRKQLEEEAPREQQNPRVTDTPYELRGKYDTTLEVAEHLIRQTQTLQCPWHIIHAEDKRFRELRAGEIILDSIQRRLDLTLPTTPLPALAPPQDRLAQVKLEKALEREDYKAKLAKYQARLQDLAWRAYRQRRSLVAVFEGWDGAGKGSAIRRVTGAIDPRLYKLVQIAAPTDEELAHQYLWRFWRQLQRDGRINIFDRSWYGRVLVERVEGFARDEEWQRAYIEINEMEAELARHGSIIAKFWIHISPEEQLARFKAREQEPHKQHKITEDDWRNRDKWPKYERAVNDMLEHTSSRVAPWTLVAGNDKPYARVQILKALCRTLEAALD
jgi:polyphosphate:AMP phosphotransferase